MAALLPAGCAVSHAGFADTAALAFTAVAQSPIASRSSARLAWNSTRAILPSRKIHTEPEISSTSTSLHGGGHDPIDHDSAASPRGLTRPKAALTGDA
jgi:hypothetical protein